MTQLTYEMESQTSTVITLYHNNMIAKARPEDARRHPSHPVYRAPPNNMPSTRESRLPWEDDEPSKEIKKPKQKSNKDYLEIFE